MPIKTHAELRHAVLQTVNEKLYEQEHAKIEREERHERAREATSRRTWIVVRVFIVLSAAGLLTREHVGPLLGYLFSFLASLLPLLPLCLTVGAVYLHRRLMRIGREEVR